MTGNHLLDVLTEGFDLVLYCGKLPDSGFYYQKIRDWSKLTCASPGYLKACGTPKHPKDLIDHNCIDHYDNFRKTWGYSIESKHTEFFVNGNLKSNSSMDLKNLAVADLGIVYLPDFIVQQEIKAGKLKTLLDHYV